MECEGPIEWWRRQYFFSITRGYGENGSNSLFFFFLTLDRFVTWDSSPRGKICSNVVFDRPLSQYCRSWNRIKFWRTSCCIRTTFRSARTTSLPISSFDSPNFYRSVWTCERGARQINQGEKLRPSFISTRMARRRNVLAWGWHGG